MANTPNEEVISDEFIRDVCTRLDAGKSVRRSLPGHGQLSIDRQLPFLCVYRRDPNSSDVGTQSFANHEAAYLCAPGNLRIRTGLKPLINGIIQSSSRRFGQFLVLEVRSAPDTEVRVSEHEKTAETQLPRPAFRIHATANRHATETVNALHFGLEQIQIHREPAQVDVCLNEHVHSPGLKRLLPERVQYELNCHVIGLEILPIYRDPETGSLLPDVLEVLRRKVSTVLKKAFYAFAVHHTTLNPHHYYALGRSRLSQSVWDIDQRLSLISQQIDVLLLTTPINGQSAWHAFHEGQYENEPKFQTRPLPFDPFVVKRELMNILVERVDDPTIAHLFRQVQSELDRQLTMLTDIGSERFVHGSLQVYGRVESRLLKLAQSIMTLTSRNLPNEKKVRRVGPAAFARRAEKEVERYRKLDRRFRATVELREDLFSGLMVSGTQLLVGRETSMSADRVAALLSHEIGTHLVTRHNGLQQPMQLLQSGLAGYDPLQEGLAVLAEFLVGGLTVARLRLLGARVIATDAMINGADFRTTFRQLTDEFCFDHQTAYTIVLRIFRGGGLTKDAAYLRGLNQVIQYLGNGGDLEPLYVGKLAATHLPLIRELLMRRVLQPPAILPLYLSARSAATNLSLLRSFNSVLDLANHLLSDDSQPQIPVTS